MFIVLSYDFDEIKQCCEVRRLQSQVPLALQHAFKLTVLTSEFSDGSSPTPTPCSMTTTSPVTLLSFVRKDGAERSIEQVIYKSRRVLNQVGRHVHRMVGSGTWGYNINGMP